MSYSGIIFRKLSYCMITEMKVDSRENFSYLVFFFLRMSTDGKHTREYKG